MLRSSAKPYDGNRLPHAPDLPICVALERPCPRRMRPRNDGGSSIARYVGPLSTASQTEYRCAVRCGAGKHDQVPFWRDNRFSEDGESRERALVGSSSR
jgi:hypothetical protein